MAEVMTDELQAGAARARRHKDDPVVKLTDEQRAFAEKNIHAVDYFVGKKIRTHPHLPLDDIRSACGLALCTAAATWRKDKGSFMTHMGWQVRAEILRLIREARPVGYKNIERFPHYPCTVAAGDGIGTTADCHSGQQDEDPVVWLAILNELAAEGKEEVS